MRPSRAPRGQRAPLASSFAAAARMTAWFTAACLTLGCRSAPPSASPEPSGVTDRETASPVDHSADSHSPPAGRGQATGPGMLGPLVAHYAGVPPRAAVAVAVLLHGYGDRGEGLVPLARELVAAQPGLAVVALEARLPDTRGGRMWWPIDIERVRSARARGAWPELERERPPGVDEACAAVAAALRALEEQGVARERVILAGFSQGAMLAVDVGLSHPELVRAVVAWSGAVLDRDRWEQSAPEGVHFVVAHGQRDTVLPFAQGEALHSLLQRLDPRARWVPFDGPHTVSSEGRRALLDLLSVP